MMVNVVGTNDGSEFAHRTFSDVVSNEALGDLVARDLIAEYKVGSTISEVTIAIAMDGVKG